MLGKAKRDSVKLRSVLLCLGLMLWAVTGYAQISTAKIEGVVRDKNNGQPLAGVQVTCEGTRLGNVTNNDGYFFILNVPPGRRSITFSYTGYQKVTVANQLILAGQTTTINAELSTAVVEMEGIVVEGQSEVLVPRDNTVSKSRMTSESIAATPATKLEDMLLMEPGVQIGGIGGLDRGLRIRGGRVGEEAMVVDGLIARNYTADPFRSGLGWIWDQELGSLGEDATPLEFSTSSVEEVDIITGGFQAEYGNAQSGIINIVTTEGGPNYRGRVRMTTDQANPRTSDYGYNQLQTSLGGPVKLIPNMYFHGSAEIQGQADRNPTHADEGFRGINQDFVDHLNDAVRNDPVLGLQMPAFTLDEFKVAREAYAAKTGESASLWSPLNPVRQPGDWGDRTLISGKLTDSPMPGLKLIGSANFSRNQHAYPWRNTGNYFLNGIATRETMPLADWDGKYGGAQEVYVSQSYARRTRTSNILAGADWEFYKSTTRSAALQFRFSNFETQDINSSDPKVNYKHDNTFLGWDPHDVPFEMESYPGREWQYDENVKLFPDGVSGWKLDYTWVTPFSTHFEDWLYYLTYRYQREHQKNWKTDFDFQINRHNRAKVGFQYTSFDNMMFNTDYMTPLRNLDNEFNYQPNMLAVYVQNRTDLGDFVIDYGVRYDRFNPVDNWGFRNGDQYGQDYFPKVVDEISPRFDVAFPVTDKSQLRFSYGAFTQLPSLTYIFDGSNPGGLEYSRTDAFEAGLSYLLNEDMVLDMVTYYRDIDGNVASRTFFRDYYETHSERRIRSSATGYSNRDNGNIKGVDFSIKRKFANNYSVNLIYTLQFSRTTGSQINSTSYLKNFLDNSTGEVFTPPDELRPIDGDRTHSITANFSYLVPQDFKSGTILGTLLKEVRVNAIYTLNSGAPMTDYLNWYGGSYGHNAHDDVTWLTRRNGKPIGGVNFFRDRWSQNLDLRMSKNLRLGGTRQMSLFCEVFNALNRKFNTPYPKGLSYENNSHITGGVDWNWDDPSISDADRVRFNADFNGDGILSVMEATKGAIAESVMLSTMDKEAWGAARQIRLGAEFSF